MKVYLVLIEVAIDSRKWNSLWSRSKLRRNRLAFFPLRLFSIHRYFFIARFTFRRITFTILCFVESTIVRNIKWTDFPYDICRSIFVACETNYVVTSLVCDHRSIVTNVSILRYVTNELGRGKFEVWHVWVKTRSDINENSFRWLSVDSSTNRKERNTLNYPRSAPSLEG